MPLPGGGTGSANTWWFTDSGGITIGRAYTASNPSVYRLVAWIRSWNTTDYLHIQDQIYTSTYNHYYVETPGGVWIISWVTTFHRWEVTPSSAATTYTSHAGKTSTSGCWNGSPCPPPWW
jgi:hypothetical protein